MFVVINFLLFILSLLGLWFSSELILKSVSRLCSKLRLPSFIVSFFILGFLTSLPEMNIGISSIVRKKPDIFVGNLTGASIVIFLLAIPPLAVLGNGIILPRQLPKKKLILSILTIITPFLLLLDGYLNYFDAFVLITAYFLLISSIKHKRRLFRKIMTVRNKTIAFNPILELGKVVIGSILNYSVKVGI